MKKKDKIQIAFGCVGPVAFRGRPRGWRLASRPNTSAARACHVSDPNAWERVTSSVERARCPTSAAQGQSGEHKGAIQNICEAGVPPCNSRPALLRFGPGPHKSDATPGSFGVALPGRAAPPKTFVFHPNNEKGQRKRKLFQFLTDETGIPRLDWQISTISTLMRAAIDKDQFKELYGRAFGKQLQTQGRLFSDPPKALPEPS